MVRYELRTTLFMMLLVFGSCSAMLSHFTPSQIIKDFMRRTNTGTVLIGPSFNLPDEFIQSLQACPPNMDSKTCERRAQAINAAYGGKVDRETLNNRARALLGLDANSDDNNMYPTVNLVSLLRAAPHMGEEPLTKNKFELKTKDVASALKFKNKNAISAIQSWFCTLTLFC